MIDADLQIFEQKLDDGNGTITILLGGMNEPNPKAYMDGTVSKYVTGELYNEFIEIFLDNPYVRVIISGINEIKFVKYNNQTLNKLINNKK